MRLLPRPRAGGWRSVRGIATRTVLASSLLGSAGAEAMTWPPAPAAPTTESKPRKLAGAGPLPLRLRGGVVSGGSRSRSRAGTAARFLGGAAVGLGLHEGSHLLANRAYGVDVDVERVQFAGVPFFALSHPAGLPARQEYVISSAGIWSQHLSSEWILSSRPHLRHEQAPLLKGVLAFDVLLSSGYGLAALARVGPDERDPRGMAAGSGLPEPLVGGLILVPAALDTWRYHRPRAKWPRRLSRLTKLGLVAIAFADLPL